MFTPDNLPNLLKEVEKFKEALAAEKTPSLWQHLDQAQKAVQQVQESLTNPQQKKILSDLLGESAKARKDLETMMPTLLADLKKRQEANLATIQELAAGIENAEMEFEAKLKAEAELAAAVPPEPTAVPEVGLDANLGMNLAREFLLAAGLLDKAPQKDRWVDEGSIARHWDESEEAQEPRMAPSPPPSPVVSPPPVPPAPATPGSGVFRTVRKKSIPPKSAPPKSGDAWEGLSQAGE